MTPGYRYKPKGLIENATLIILVIGVIIMFASLIWTSARYYGCLNSPVNMTCVRPWWFL